MAVFLASIVHTAYIIPPCFHEKNGGRNRGKNIRYFLEVPHLHS